MSSVYILHHWYESEGFEEIKLLGVYSSKANAQSALERYAQLPGFKHRTDDFHIGRYTIDEDAQWKEGYATMTTIMIKDSDGNWMPVAAAELPGPIYEIPDSYHNDLLGEFKGGDILECRRGDDGELYALRKVN